MLGFANPEWPLRVPETQSTFHPHAQRNVFRPTLRPFISFFDCRVESKKGRNLPVKYWELVADKLSKAGWSMGWVSAVDSEGRTIWIADAHRDNGKRFIVTADEKLRAFLELQRVTHESFRFPNAE
jgi:hypothetical protein